MTENKSSIVLAIDIGNTRTHVAAVDLNSFSCLKKTELDNGHFDNLIPNIIQQFSSTYPSILQKVNISSCVKSLSTRAADICHESGFENIGIVKVHSGLSVEFQYENPQTLGSDRVADALACSKLFKDKSCIKIGSGTAITIDFLIEGKRFAGGIILPGIAMQLKSLQAFTDALPLVDIKDLLNVGFPGKSTAQCIAAGVLHSSAGAMERCVREYRHLYGEDSLVVATGGAWAHSARLVGFDFIEVSDLTLIGTACF